MSARRIRGIIRIVACIAVAMCMATSARAQGGSATQAYGTVLASMDSAFQFGATLSPDGRWIAFNGPALRSVSNGKLIPLAVRGQEGSRPVWFPTSDQIAFRDGSGILRVAIDRASGAPKGMPKRVSLERATGGFDVSPDGGHIVYRTETAPNGRAQLKVIPATGGNARVLVDSATNVFFPRFSADGRFVFYITDASVMRVPVGGGRAVRVFGPDPAARLFEPHRQLVLLQGSPRTATIVNVAGDTIASIPLRDGIPPGWGSVMRFAPDGRSLVAYEIKEKTTLAVLSRDNSSPRTIGSGSDDFPLFWSPDGDRIFCLTGSGTTSALVMIDAKSGSRVSLLTNAAPVRRTSGLQDFAISRDGQFLAYTRVGNGEPNSFFVFDIAKRGAREVARGADLRGLSDNARADGVHEFAYVLPTPNGSEVHLVTPEGTDRLVARLPSAGRVFGIIGDTLAYGVESGDSTTVFVIRGARSSPQRFLTFAGRRYSADASGWSPDGRTLGAITYSGTAEHPVYRVMFADVNEGSRVTHPRYVTVEEGWRLTWLSDGSGVSMLGMNPTGTVTNVWRVPKTGTSPMSLTSEIHDPFWGYAISPDGNALALPVEHIVGSIVWRIDLDAAAAGYRAGQRGTARP